MSPSSLEAVASQIYDVGESRVPEEEVFEAVRKIGEGAGIDFLGWYAAGSDSATLEDR